RTVAADGGASCRSEGVRTVAADGGGGRKERISPPCAGGTHLGEDGGAMCGGEGKHSVAAGGGVVTAVPDAPVRLAERTRSVAAGGGDGAGSRGEANPVWVVTDVRENDSILGSDRKLRETILSLHKSRWPELIFVLTTPVVAINNDDVAAVAAELAEELGIPVIPIYTDGFHSKLGVYGLDLAAHGLARHLLPSPGALERAADSHGFVNVLAMTESRAVIGEVVRYLDALGIKSNVLPRFATKDGIAKAAYASCNLALNPWESAYFARMLGESYGIPTVDAAVPFGVRQTDRWLEAIGKTAGGWQRAQDMIRSTGEATRKELAKWRLDGVRIFLSVRPHKSDAIWGLLTALGAEVVGVKLPYLDALAQKHLENIYKRNPDLPLLVGEGQPFESVNLMRKTGASACVSDDPSAGSIGHIPVLDLREMMDVGYAGAVTFVKSLHRLVHYDGFSRNFGDGDADGDTPYRDTWFGRSVGWYIKQEVK
ncbi:MAG: nitrogenase component 1, partial [Lachnospiraceae bacterium]|nr:nitrogenase component 1 [Lachnospiraceae bacterium]